MTGNDNLRVFIPVYTEVREILRQHRLMTPLDYLAAYITLKIAAELWRLIREHGGIEAPEGPEETTAPN